MTFLVSLYHCERKVDSDIIFATYLNLDTLQISYIFHIYVYIYIYIYIYICVSFTGYRKIPLVFTISRKEIKQPIDKYML